MKKNLFKKDSSKLTKDSNKNSIFMYKNEQEKDDSISIDSETIEEKMNILMQLKKLQKKNLIETPLSESQNKIESSIITKSKQKANNIQSNINNIIEKSLLSESEEKNKPEIKNKKQNGKFTEFKNEKRSNKKEIDSNLENGIYILNNIVKNNISYKKFIFFENLKEEIKKNLNPRAPKKKRTQKMLVKKGTFREIPKKEKEIVEDEKIEEIEEYSLDDEAQDNDTFIRIHNDGYYEVKANQSQLDEYDLFYKEQFFRNELFRYDVENIQDKEEQDITKQMNKLDCKRRLKEKKKLKEVNDLKGLDTTELNHEIKKLTKEYENFKKEEEPKVELELNNTEKLLQKGRILGFYFKENQNKDFPHFSMYDFKEKGAKEIIDFKMLRKEEEARRYFDYHCLLEQRKKINEIMVYVRFYCRLLVDNPIFDYFSLLVIILNTVLILISDPTDNNNLGNLSDNYFLYFYTLECILKILAFRFWSAEDAYIKDYWNILDFFVVVVGWILFIIENALNGTKISGLAGLRAFRILRPLKTVKRFKGLKKLVTALLASISHLGETTIVLVFVFLIFAIGGRQMWMGNFYRRCMNINYGFMYSTQGSTMMCSFDTDCEELDSYGVKYICAKGYLNPNSGAISFDDTLAGFVTIFVMVTLEGWTDVFTYVSKTFKDKIYINPIIVFFYFHVFVILCAFYLINLFLAVTNSEFEKIEADRKLLSEKKSFYKLIKDRFDMKEREKKEKKEKERLLKASNNKKSNETLRELYYKITDEAFHIHKNKKEIPILYSTVKDMYIQSNHNPEELYLQSLQIEEEDRLLGKDIKRQQREIDDLIKKKKKEDKKKSDDENKNNRVQSEIIEQKEKGSLKRVNTNKNVFEGFQLNITKKKEKDNKNRNEIDKILFHSKSNIIHKKSVKIEDKEEKISESTRKLREHDNILKELRGINSDVIEISIDNAQKALKEKIAEIAKDVSNNQGKKKKKIGKFNERRAK